LGSNFGIGVEAEDVWPLVECPFEVLEYREETDAERECFAERPLA
jgi:hypothetical protein